MKKTFLRCLSIGIPCGLFLCRIAKPSGYPKRCICDWLLDEEKPLELIDLLEPLYQKAKGGHLCIAKLKL